ncbi:glycosyltransferase [Butyrivibrio sp. INlla16]|uniref:glycosyltransferase n=1 Tax=Butyrivibrio sp. INlla16 TaxID=1520807 RepID=UPI000883DB57|nr:glycosyltransferase [Butyrivibrio sp. INlla16]SDB60255.1 Glycosyltransferase, GT2 family [Butyrivibrio sp. INlla16]
MAKGTSYPLVSIIIPNFNHSRYLDESIQSALNQTYPNIEVIVSDNASTDNSIEVISKYVDRGVIVNKNPQNLYNFNYDILDDWVEGDYFVLLCADDVLKETFVGKAVAIMEQHPEVGFVHGERDYIDENGVITELDPFFNCSFIAPGEEVMPIFSVTDIGQSAQAVIRTSAFKKIELHDTESDHLNIDREQWFRLSMVSDYAYIREKMALIRMPEVTSETSRIVETFYHPIALYHTAKSFEEWAKLRNYPKVEERVELSLKRFAKECLGFTKVFLKREKFDLSKQYLLFMKLVDREVVKDPDYIQCIEALERKDASGIAVEEYKKSSNYSKRKRNYEPPENYTLLEV